MNLLVIGMVQWKTVDPHSGIEGGTTRRKGFASPAESSSPRYSADGKIIFVAVSLCGCRSSPKVAQMS